MAGEFSTPDHSDFDASKPKGDVAAGDNATGDTNTTAVLDSTQDSSETADIDRVIASSGVAAENAASPAADSSADRFKDMDPHQASFMSREDQDAYEQATGKKVNFEKSATETGQPQQREKTKYELRAAKESWLDKLTGKSKEVIQRLYAGAKEAIPDRVKIWYGDQVVNLRSFLEKNSASAVKDSQDKLTAIQDREQKFAGDVAKMMEKLGVSDPKVMASVEAERKEMADKVTEAKSALEKSQSLLVERQTKRVEYEQSRDKLVDAHIEKISGELAPLNEQISTLESDQKQLDLEVENFRTNVESLETQAADLAALAKGTEFKVIAKQYQDKADQVEQVAKKMRAQLETREGQRDKIQDQLNDNTKKRDLWQAKKELLVSHKTEARLKAAGQSAEGGAIAGDASSAVYEAPAAAKYDSRDALSSVIDYMEALDEEAEKKLTGSKLLELWNSQFGSKMKVDAKRYEQVSVSKLKGRLDQQTDLKSFEKLMIVYYRKFLRAPFNKEKIKIKNEKELLGNIRFLALSVENKLV